MKRFKISCAITFAALLCACSSSVTKVNPSQTQEAARGARGISFKDYSLPIGLWGFLAVAYGGFYSGGDNGVAWWDGFKIGDFGPVPIQGYTGFINGNDGPNLTVGPDGAIYATAVYQNNSNGSRTGAIIRYDPYHHSEGVAFTTPQLDEPLGRMAFDGSGRLWIASEDSSYEPYLGIVTKPGTNEQSTTEVDTHSDVPYAFASAPDGSIWGVGYERSNGHYGSDDLEGYKFASNGPISERHKVYGQWNLQETLADATFGADGALWIVAQNTPTVFRLTTSGTLKRFPVKTTGSFYQIAAGGDGALWATLTETNKLVRISVDGVRRQYSVPQSCGGVTSLTGPANTGLKWIVFVNCGSSLLEVQ